MLISIDWIKDFVDIDLDKHSAKELAELFTLRTAEVEDIKESNAILSKIFVAKIEKIEKHPDADKLNLVTFSYGKNLSKQVVCGAPNVEVGLFVPYAPLGTTLPNGFTLEPKKIRGILSEGMLCSCSELGLQGNPSGLMVLNDFKNISVGQPLSEALQLKKDIILDVDNKSLTHRPDLWGIVGIAREFAAILQQDLKLRFDKKWEDNFKNKFSKDKSPITPIFEGKSAGKRYIGLSVDKVTVAPSPQWMVDRLEKVGLRSINNIVDISNYVMIELGIPLHIFDREKINGDKLVIKEMGCEKEFVTLDGVPRKLIATDTVISDSNGPLVLAGIMGGLNCGVSDNTTKVFIEVANWFPAKVRKTSTRLGLRTDSSQRYEKSLDSTLLERTLFRTLELILELSPNAVVVGKMECAGERPEDIPVLKIELTYSRINKYLGIELAKTEIDNILNSLDFKIASCACKCSSNSSPDRLTVIVPTYRSTKDIECDADIIEEIGRVIGYGKIVPSSPLTTLSPVSLMPAHQLKRKIQNFCVHKGNAFEIMTYPMAGEKLFEKAKWDYSKAPKILNSISTDFAFMRTSIVPAILEKVALNQKNFDNFRLFEIGRVYSKGKDKFADEYTHLVAAYYNKNKNEFIDLANNIESMINATNIQAEIVEKNSKFTNEVVDNNWFGLHPYEQLNIRVMGKFKGMIFSLHPLMLREYKIKGNLALVVFDLTSLQDRPGKDKLKYSPLPKFPTSEFDCTVVVKKGIAAVEVLNSLKQLKVKEFVDCKIVDVFNLDEENSTVTLRSTMMDVEKTLESSVIESIKNRIVETLSRSGFPLKA